MSGRRALYLILLFVSSALAVQQTHAQSASVADHPDIVTLVLEPCSSYDARDFENLFALELRAVGVARLVTASNLASVQPSAGLALVHLVCDPNGTNVNAEVADFVSGNQMRRELPLADVEPRSRARALALAVASLVETSWLALAARGPGAPTASNLPWSVRIALRKRLQEAFVDTERPPGQKSVAHAKPSEPSERVLALFALSRSFPSRGTALIGAELSYLATLSTVRLMVSADALGGSHELLDATGTLADVQLYWLSGGLSVMWSTQTTPDLLIGPFARVGYAFAAASNLRPGYTANDNGHTVAVVGVTTLLRAELAPHVNMFLGFDLGYTPSGVVFHAGDNRVAGMAEITAALRLGLGLAL